MSESNIDFVVFDDSGLLSLVDCNSYASFVSADWTYESIVEHFKQQMRLGSILVWHCGDGGGPYSIRVRKSFTDQGGFREVTGSIVATTGRLHLVSYDALAMAAQFEDETLPSKHEVDLGFGVSPGSYRVRIVQTFDPDRTSETPAPDFLIEIEPGQAPQLGMPAWL